MLYFEFLFELSRVWSYTQRDHWQLILMSPREQNSHCCSSSLETAGLPCLRWLAGWAAAVSKSHKSPPKLILIANFCYINTLFFFNCMLQWILPIHCFTASPCKVCVLQVLKFHCKDTSIPQLLKKLLSQSWMGLKSFFFFLFFSCIHNSPQGSFGIFNI